MRASIYWIAESPYRLAILPRPRGGEWLEDEIRSLRSQGVDVLVSVLTPAETVELGLQREAECSAATGMDFAALPIEDRGIPTDLSAATTLIKRLAGDLRNGKAVAIHCRAGIGRSGMIAACVLGRVGMAVDEAFTLLAAARGCGVPDTDEQREWAAGSLRA